MIETYENFKELSNLYTGEDTNLDNLAIEYQQTEDPCLLVHVFCKWFPYTVSQVSKYFYLTEEDKASFVVEELHKAMTDFDVTRGAKIQTLFSRYLNNRLRAETQMMNHHKRRANNSTDSYQAFAEVTQGHKELGYDQVEFLNIIRTSCNLNDNEVKYCEIVTSVDPNNIKDTDIAKLLGVTSAAINYMKKKLAEKLLEAGVC